MRNGRVREYALVFERVTTRPVKTADGWLEQEVSGDHFALYWDKRPLRKLYFESTEEAQEVLSVIAEELGLRLTWQEFTK